MNPFFTRFALTRHTQVVSFVLFMLSVQSVSAQMHINADVHVSGNTTLYIASGALSFGTSGNTRTERTAPFGVVRVADAVTVGSGNALQHINGWFYATKSGSFVAPLGDGARFAPLALSSKTTDALLTCAYVRANPETVSPAIDGTLEVISEDEFWTVSSNDQANLTLSWRSDSAIGALTNNTLGDLTIAGYNGSFWIQIPSTIDATSLFAVPSTLELGSVTTTYPIDLNNFTHFTLAKKGFCRTILTFSGTTCTWNGTSWSPHVPGERDRAVVNAPYTGALSCFDIVLNANLTLEDNQTLDLVAGFVSGLGKVIMASSASVVQRDDTAMAPPIEFRKVTAPVRRHRYVYWGTPITGNFFSQIDGATATASGSASNAFDLRWRYVSGDNSANGGWQTLTATEQGRGFISRVRTQAPFVDNTYQGTIAMTFEGTAGNGVVEKSIQGIAAPFTASRNFNLLANPYPSAIDAEAFLRLNASSIDGAIYLWDSQGASVNGQFSQSDYRAWTLAGDNTLPGFGTLNGVIPSAQGFKVRATAATGTVLFNNCIRLTQDNNQFYRVDGSVLAQDNEDKNRYKVALSDMDGATSSILVAYHPQYTSGYDMMYDAYALAGASITLYGVLPQTGAPLAIDARQGFMVEDEVAIGVRKTGTTLTTFQISVYDREGVFAQGQPIYLYDSVLGTYELFTENTPLTIQTTAAITSDRYQLRYSAPLSTPDIDQPFSAVVWHEAQHIGIKASEPIAKALVFDLAGRLLHEALPAGLKQFDIPFDRPQSTYIIRMYTEDGRVSNFKLINSL